MGCADFTRCVQGNSTAMELPTVLADFDSGFDESSSLERAETDTELESILSYQADSEKQGSCAKDWILKKEQCDGKSVVDPTSTGSLSWLNCVQKRTIPENQDNQDNRYSPCKDCQDNRKAKKSSMNNRSPNLHKTVSTSTSNQPSVSPVPRRASPVLEETGDYEYNAPVYHFTEEREATDRHRVVFTQWTEKASQRQTRYYDSAPFRSKSGHKLALRVYPNGFRFTGFLSLFLLVLPCSSSLGPLTSPVLLRLTNSFPSEDIEDTLNPDRLDPIPSPNRSGEPVSRGVPLFCKTDKLLKETGFLMGDCLTFEVVITNG